MALKDFESQIFLISGTVRMGMLFVFSVAQTFLSVASKSQARMPVLPYSDDHDFVYSFYDRPLLPTLFHDDPLFLVETVLGGSCCGIIQSGFIIISERSHADEERYNIKKAHNNGF